MARFRFTILALILLSTSVGAAEVRTYSCQEIFVRKYLEEVANRGQAHRLVFLAGRALFSTPGINAVLAGGTAGFSALSEAGATVEFSAPVGSVSEWTFPPGTEGRVLGAVQTFASRQQEHFARNIRRELPDVDDARIQAALEAGFASGEFCGKFTMMTPRSIRQQVIQKLRNH